jgi:hypothetical protein
MTRVAFYKLASPNQASLIDQVDGATFPTFPQETFYRLHDFCVFDTCLNGG